MASVLKGLIDWGLSRDMEGHRTYTARWLCETTNVADGPSIVANTPGLPATGSTWNITGPDGTDSDPFAFNTPILKVTPDVKREKNRFWTVENTFTTKPQNRCQDTSIEDPLLEPEKVSGSFAKFTREKFKDKDGKPFLSSSFEQIRGSVVEFDDNRPTVRIEKNLLILPFTNPDPASDERAGIVDQVDTLNDSLMWGLDPRKIKLSNVSWQRKIQGICGFYFTVSYEFELDFNTFDRQAQDKGRDVLNEGGDPTKIEDFAPARAIKKDANGKLVVGEGELLGEQFLDGAGKKALTEDDIALIDIVHYQESNMALLGINTVTIGGV